MRKEDSNKIYGSSIRSPLTGFTLIEVVLAVGLSAIIMIGLTVSFWSGSNVWKRTRGMTELSGNLRFAMDVLNTDLYNAIKLPQQTGVASFSISGDGKELIFFTVKRLKHQQVSHIYKVNYKLIEDSNSLGEPFVLKRASKEINNFTELHHEFDPEDYNTLVSGLTGEELKFRGSIFGNVMKLCHTQLERIDSDEILIEIIKLIREEQVKGEQVGKEQEEIIFPCKVFYDFTQP